MGEKRVNVGVMARPELKAKLQRQAAVEGRTVSQLAERLLGWAMDRLAEVGDSQNLVARKSTGRSLTKGRRLR